MKLSGKRVAILATHGFEQSELEVPLAKLKEAGAKVDVVSPEKGEIKGWDRKDWGRPVTVDRSLGDASVDDYDAVVLPGGQINPDLLRINDKALEFIRAFFDQKKVVAAICHAPWLLIETGVIKGRKATSYHVWMAPVWQEITSRAAQKSLAVMCPACSRSPDGLLALMESANRGLITRAGSMSQ